MNKDTQRLKLRQLYKMTQIFLCYLWGKICQYFLLASAFAVAAVVSFISFRILNAYIAQFDTGIPSSKHETWGQLGDFFGGTLNPVIGLATLLMLLINVFLQQKQLKHAQDESKATQVSAAKQSFEQSFFSLLSNYRELLNCVSTETEADSKENEKQMNPYMPARPKITPKQYQGRDALKYLWDKYMLWSAVTNLTQDEYPGITINEGFNPHAQTLSEDTVTTMRTLVSLQFNSIVYDHITNIFPLLNSIVLTLEWLDSHEEQLSEDTKRFTLLLISSLSTTELLMIFFHSHFSGGTSQKTIDIFCKYSIFSSIRNQDHSSLHHNVYDFSRKYGVGKEKKKFPDSAFSEV